jgi:acyl-CoA thioesterase YciA
MPPASKHAQGRPPAIRVAMMPRDTNAWGTIFGGIILSYIDQAGAQEAHEIGCNHVVTVAMKEVEFHEPVHVGDLVSFYTDLLQVGRTSVRVKVTVEAQRRPAHLPVQHVVVTEAEVVYVNIGPDGRPRAIDPPPRG